MKFAKLQISEPILRALKDAQYVNPTPIQKESIPITLKGRDILGIAQTGTGKTAAFAIPTIEKLYKATKPTTNRKNPRSLVITPTRELAIQVGENFRKYSKYTDLKCATIYGGVSVSKQIGQLKKGCDILIATPGRLLDLIHQGELNTRFIRTLILDEADRMLDMGFIRDIQKILKFLPRKKQTLFFSATMPDEIKKLSSKILYRPYSINIEKSSPATDSVDQFVYFTNRSLKKKLILKIIHRATAKKILIFTRTKRGADHLARFLSKKNIKTTAIHGNKAQSARQRALKQFKNGTIKIMVATDIAARGIDVDNIDLVVNYDIPNMPDTYVHRIGRSGRAGKLGKSVSICEPEHNEFFKEIEKFVSQKIKRVEDHPYQQTDKPMTASEKRELNKKKERRKMAYFSKKRFMSHSA